MSKFEYMVEADINGKWVHAHCATLDEAIVLKDALRRLDNMQNENGVDNIFDVDIFAAEGASDTAKNAVSAYQRAEIVETLADSEFLNLLKLSKI